MGSAYSFDFAHPSAPPGAVEIVIESDDWCGMEACTGRTFDRHQDKPSFVTMTDREWTTFTHTIHGYVKCYKPENMGFLILILLPIGAVANMFMRGDDECDSRNCGLPFGSMFFFVMAIIGFIFATTTMRRINMAIDAKIDEVCHANTSGSTLFQFQTRWTNVCKPRGARTYRAIVIAPGPSAGSPAVAPTAAGVAVPPSGVAIPTGVVVTVAVQPATTRIRVTCPPGQGAGDSITVQAPSGGPYTVTVPEGVQSGALFDVELPAAPPLVVEGQVVAGPAAAEAI
jgi:hypothetical protein